MIDEKWNDPIWLATEFYLHRNRPGIFKEQDEFIFKTVAYSPDWEKAWHELLAMEEGEYAYLPDYGYLTVDPKQCGTGLVIKTILHLPALLYANELEGHRIECADIVSFTNPKCIGVTEDEILHTMHKRASTLMIAEKRQRDTIASAPPVEIVDRVSRAYALLRFARTLNQDEIYSSISALKLGIDLGWVSGITDKQLSPHTVSEAIKKCTLVI